MADVENVIIVGSGPAGYTAALYTSRANLTPARHRGLLLGRPAPADDRRRELPRLPRGHHGPGADAEDARPGRALRHALRHRPRHQRRARQRARRHPHASGSATRSTAPAPSILAMGAEHKKLGVPGEEELGGARRLLLRHLRRRLLPRPATTIIVGGGDSAMEEAIFLAKFAVEGHVVHRRDEFRASKIMLERARAIDNIEFLTPYVVEEFARRRDGAARARARAAQRRDRRDARAARSTAPSSRSATSRSPRSSRGQVRPTTRATSSPRARSTRTELPGVFAAGDLVDHTYRQAVTAAGSGCQAALDAEWYLRDTPEVPTPAGLPEGDLAEAQWSPAQAPERAASS